ncbi:hypothetical protein D8770_08720 [Methylobacterium sp. DB1607]|jgi:hypothetical protein|nr:hypothetical protein [Methylobacterium sp. DB1607]
MGEVGVARTVPMTSQIRLRAPANAREEGMGRALKHSVNHVVLSFAEIARPGRARPAHEERPPDPANPFR